MNHSIVRVIKVGGSLFDFADLPAALTRWLVRQPPAMNVLVAGGGSLVDAIRRADSLFPLGDENAHWLSISLMDVNARLLAGIMQMDCESDFEALRETARSRTTSAPMVFRVETFLRDVEPRWDGVRLPHDWSATSDSIAARVAECLAAHELVLLKSTLQPVHSRELAGTPGYVDAHFETVAAKISLVRFVDLRSSDFRESRWSRR